MKKEQYILCGKIGRPFGVKGELKVFWHNLTAPIVSGGKVYLQAAEMPRALTLVSSRVQQDHSVVRFAEVADRTQAEALTNAELWLDERNLKNLAQHEYYAYQLIGMQVFDEAEKLLGEIVQIYSTGSNDVYEVLPPGKKPGEELAIPAVQNVIQKVDLSNKRMTIKSCPDFFLMRSQMQFDLVSIFPDLFSSVLSETIIKRAQEKALVNFAFHDPRKYTEDKHHTVDDTPYGGGAGMVMLPEPLVKTIEAIPRKAKSRRILLSPRGVPFQQKLAHELAELDQLILVSGRYEGVDQRVIDLAIDQEISIGDYVLSGGEIGALVIIDAVTRLIPGVLGNSTSFASESFENGLLEYPQYTRPREFRGLNVPEVLLSGNHKAIEEWRAQQALEKTQEMRPDLLTKKR